MKIVTFNLNSWMPVKKMPYRNRITTLAQHIKEKYGDDLPEVIALQEVIAGRDGKNLDELDKAFDGCYRVCGPMGDAFDYTKHSRSIINVTLCKADYKPGILMSPASVLPNRFIINEYNGIGIINVHVPQVANLSGKAGWYIRERRRLRRIFWHQLIKFAGAVRDDYTDIIIVGDLQEGSDGTHIAKLKKLGFTEPVEGVPTVDGSFFREHCIDHILLSSDPGDFGTGTGTGSLEVDSTLTKSGLSDHHMLCLNI
ncbi:Endonuclease/Exonuclease/phosphatase family protein [Ruminococcaceae bacterium YRB3002]|nr:Endonuclease/Exonuclease/phosphatase family protein [Ruminococcaceae bacterium YRB3002]